MMCLRGERKMQGDHVGFLVEGFKRNIFRKICNIRILVPVIGEYAASESSKFLYDGAPDLSGAYDPHCKILQFPAYISGISDNALKYSLSSSLTSNAYIFMSDLLI